MYSVFRNGKWDTPYQIDRFLPMPGTPFLARRLSRAHIILYYRTGRTVLSAREMLLEPYTMGSVTPLIQTPVPCSDLSIVNDTEKIHLLYIVRGMFRTQVVYQYKHTSAISTPRILWEDSGCDHCLITLQNNRVILMWTVNGQPLRCISENGGSSFGAVEKYTDPFPTKCRKAELLGAEHAACNATECYFDPDQGNTPLIYPSHTPQEAKTEPSEADYSRAFIALQKQHKQQLEEMSALLAQRSEELAAVNARWKAQTEKLETALSRLQQENDALRAASADS
ncbi:MAG: hypothetical protein Q4C06_01910 [Bacillota bacterium]|nr:hypothetical protein [Bacillota bacterium]